MVNVMQAAYVVGSRIHLCCVPSVLCFADYADADGFRQGFGGQVMRFEDVIGELRQHHAHPSFHA
jgi:hypothetical protein